MAKGSNVIDWQDEGNNRRLLVAVFAASEDGKPNNKRIAQLFGKGATQSAIDNQMKKIKVEARKLKEEVGEGSEVPVIKKPRKHKANDNDEPAPKRAKRQYMKAAPAKVEESEDEIKDEDEIDDEE